jgi:hypothetical protein
MAERVFETGAGSPSTDVSELSVAPELLVAPVAPAEGDFSLPQPGMTSARMARTVTPRTRIPATVILSFDSIELAVLSGSMYP